MITSEWIPKVSPLMQNNRQSEQGGCALLQDLGFFCFFFAPGIIFCFTDLSLNNSCWAEAKETHCRKDEAKWERERHGDSNRETEKASKIGDRGVLRGEVTGDSLKLLGSGGPLRRGVRRGILAALALSWRITSHLKWLPGWQPLDRQFAIILGPISLTFPPLLPSLSPSLTFSHITQLLALVPHRPWQLEWQGLN